MATIAKLLVELGLEDGAFQRGIDSSRNKLDSWGSSFRSWGTGLTAGVTTPIIGAGAAFVNWASSAEQTLGATEVLWGENADTMVAWSESASTSMGMTQNAALQNANRFNAMFKTLGVGNGVVMDMSQGFTTLSADLSAMWGGSPDEAAESLTSALRGNYEAMDKYNVNLTEAMVSQEAMNVAMADGRSEVTEADKVQARYNLIMEQTTDAQGQFARETDTTAGRLATMSARVKDAATKFGTLLLPYVNKGLELFSKLVDRIEGLSDTQRKWVLGIAAVAAAIGPVLLVVGMLLPGLSALVAVIGFLVSPIGLIVVAVAALAAGLIYAYTHFEGFRNIVNAVASTIAGVAVAAFEALVGVFSKLKDAFDLGGWSGMFGALGDMLLNGLASLSNMAFAGIQWLADQFINGASSLWNAAVTWFQGLWDGASSKWGEFTGWVGGLASDAATWLGDTAGSLLLKGIDLITGLWNGAVSMWTGVTAWIAGLPGEVLTWIGDTAATLIGKGSDLLNGFFNGVALIWLVVSLWFSNLGTSVFTAVGEVISSINSRGTDILQGFWNGVTDKWIAVSLWFVNLPAMIFNAVADTSSSIKSRGTDILAGFWNGVLNKWIAVSTWFVSLGSMISGAVGNLGSILWNAGSSIMSGLWDGMKSGWGNITSWLSGLNPADFKGPEQRDKKMLYKPGIWIMQGLSRGMDEGWDDVTRHLSSYNPAIGAASHTSFAASAAGGAGQVIQIITLEPGKWQEFLADAEAGGTFARQFAPELSMRRG